MNHASGTPAQLQPVFAYHEATKHAHGAYARGPGFLDWANQPDPFRRYRGAPLHLLERVPPAGTPRYDDVFAPDAGPAPQPVNLRTLSQLFFDSLALSAWKRAGTNRWALRVNASSGNLHPTEGYLVCGPVSGLCAAPAVYHYAPRAHGLEQRACLTPALWQRLSAGFPDGTCFLALTSIPWRESWKYGTRAYRYCMLDAGHALAALGIAAAGLGWRIRLLDAVATTELGLLLGTAQAAAAEAEEPDMLLACLPVTSAAQAALPRPDAGLLHEFAALDWQGAPNRLSPSHVAWGMAAIAACVRKPHGVADYARGVMLPRPFLPPPRAVPLRPLLRQRRSAVAMDGVSRIACDTFYRMLERTLAAPGALPWSCLPWAPQVHLVVFVHRVDGLAPGLYLLVRDPAQTAALRAAIAQAACWYQPPGCPAALPLYCLQEADLRATARALACHQAIASDGCFSLAMLAHFRAPLGQYGPWFYPRLHWEAGMLGQLLYLEAEAAGMRATGIGCYFDDALHALLGLPDNTFQDIYHFTVGAAVEDERLTTEPAYPEA
ncbi:MAG: SagB/ThcOx family dehydrogenase [Pseudomonadota bacterium]